MQTQDKVPSDRAETGAEARTGGKRSSLGEQVALFKALADETRLEILRMLSRHRTALCVCEIEARFDLSQPTISHHLRLLREAGLVDAERRGTWIHYSLDADGVKRLCTFAGQLRRGG